MTEKRKLRKPWQNTRPLVDKQRLTAAFNGKDILNNIKNQELQQNFKTPSPKAATDYLIWKATRILNQPQQVNPPNRKAEGKWAKSNQDY